MTYNVFGGMLNLAQLINLKGCSVLSAAKLDMVFFLENKCKAADCF